MMSMQLETAGREPQQASTRLASRCDELLRDALRRVHGDTDRIFAGLMIVQWFAGIIFAATMSPKTWSGPESSIHPHVFAATLLGGILAALPIFLALKYPGEFRTRMVIGLTQTLYSALLIHLTGGRIETHFHVFVSLALLAFYRDWRVLLIATICVTTDHFLRGVYWPQSVFGVVAPAPWRWAEHAAWVLFEDFVLLCGIQRAIREMSTSVEHRARLEDTNIHIEAIVDERTRELALARDQALEGARTKSEFLANMSHEIRTPMNGVLGFVHLLRETELTDEQREFLDTIEGSGEALLTILNDILDLSKIEAGRLEVEEIPFEPSVAMENVSRLLAAKAAEQEIELVCRTQEVLPFRLRGDPTRLQQILFNLCGNAIKFSSGGEVVMDARMLEMNDDSLLVEFSVRDTGIGIPSDRLADLFKPFEQVDGTITRRFGGTGLGLTVVKRLVDLMGGEIEVTSREGEGSKFSIRLALPRVENRIHEVPDLTGRRFLIVDDNATNRQLLHEVLDRSGSTTVLCDSAEAAMEALAGSAPFDAALIDLQMPNADGFTLASWIRDDLRHRELKLILLTSIDFDRRELEKYSFCAYQIKPVRAVALLSDLAAACRDLEGDTEKVQALALADADHEAMAAETCSTLRVLLTEDNPVNRRLARALLEQRGHSVTVAVNGVEALRLFQETKFDLILMDAQMPEKDGITTTQEIRSLEAETGERIAIVALTAHAMSGYRERCIEAGMDDYLSKPICIEELDRVLTTTMEKLLSLAR